MNILALCSALNNSYIALKKGEEIISEVIESDENYHSLYLVEKIKNLLDNNNIKMNELDYLAVNVGPGSFTGIRVALTIAKIISGELDLPLVTLDSANILLEAFGADLYLSDARRDMYFIGDKNKIELIYKDKLEQILEENSSKKIVCDKRLADIIAGAICYEDKNRDLGRTMLKLAEKKYNGAKDKAIFNQGFAKANYIQTPPVF